MELKRPDDAQTDSRGERYVKICLVPVPSNTGPESLILILIPFVTKSGTRYLDVGENGVTQD